MSWGRAKLNHSLLWRSMVLFTVHLAASCLALSSLVKAGGGSNYALPMQFSLALLCGILVALVMSGWNRLPRGITGYSAVSFVVVMALSNVWLAKPLAQQHDRSSRNAAIAQRAKLLELVRSIPSPIYSEDMVLLVQAGREVWAEPAMVTALHDSGVWDEKPFVDMIRNKQFGLIIAGDLDSRSRFTPAVRQAIVASYRDGGQSGPNRLYWPRP